VVSADVLSVPNAFLVPFQSPEAVQSFIPAATHRSEVDCPLDTTEGFAVMSTGDTRAGIDATAVAVLKSAASGIASNLFLIVKPRSPWFMSATTASVPVTATSALRPYLRNEDPDGFIDMNRVDNEKIV